MIVVPVISLMCFAVAWVDLTLTKMMLCDTGMWIIAPVAASAGIILFIFGNCGVADEYLYEQAIYLSWGSITWSV